MARNYAPATSAALQQALNEARPGDFITLTSGVTYTGNFTFPNTQSSPDVITITSSAISDFPPNARVTPKMASKMPRIVTPNALAAIDFVPSAQGYRLVGLEITVAPGVYGFDLVRVGDPNATSLEFLPHNIELDRVYVHGDPAAGSKRGIFLNSGAVTIRNSHLSDFKSRFQDTQAIAVCTASGPFLITNNYLEAAGNNILFGGCAGYIPNLAPSDAVFTKNYLTKPLIWQSEGWPVKNLFEIKNGRRFRIAGNIFENNWVSAQSGFAILFTVRADGVTEAGAPFGIIEDILFESNVVANSPHGIHLLGTDIPRGGLARRITIRNNSFRRVTGRLVQLIDGPQDVTMTGNTAIEHTSLIVIDGGASPGFKMMRNVFTHGDYGIHASGLSEGMASINQYLSGSVITGNLMIGYNPNLYPANNTYVASVSDAGFANLAAGDLRIPSAGSPAVYGSDWPLLNAATAGAAGSTSQFGIAAAGSPYGNSPELSPGAIAVIRGTQLSRCTSIVSWNQILTSFCNTSVSIQNRPARILAVKPAAITILIPFEAVPNEDTMVTLSNGPNSTSYLIFRNQMVPAAPTLATSQNEMVPASTALTSSSATAPDANQIVALNADGSTNAPQFPALVGSRITVIAYGLGVTDPFLASNVPPSTELSYWTAAIPSVHIDGVPQNNVLARYSPSVPGAYEISFDVAATPSTSGNIISVTSDGRDSNVAAIFLASP